MALLKPKRSKYRKMFKGKRTGVATRGTSLAFGTFGLKAMSAGFISARQIESARRTVIRYLKKGGKVWFRVFTDKPFTTKGAETPMGGGKGNVDHYVFPMRPGRIIFEMEGIKEDMARKALTEAGSKLSVKTKFIKG